MIEGNQHFHEYVVEITFIIDSSCQISQLTHCFSVEIKFLAIINTVVSFFRFEANYWITFVIVIHYSMMCSSRPGAAEPPSLIRTLRSAPGHLRELFQHKMVGR